MTWIYLVSQYSSVGEPVHFSESHSNEGVLLLKSGKLYWIFVTVFSYNGKFFLANRNVCGTIEVFSSPLYSSRKITKANDLSACLITYEFSIKSIGAFAFYTLYVWVQGQNRVLK